MRLHGMPAIATADLDVWEGSAAVLQGVDGDCDRLELSVSAADARGRIEGGLHVSKLLGAQTALQLSGEYRFADMGLNGQPHQLNVTVDGVSYRSTGGRVTFEHTPGRVRGTFDAQLAREGEASSLPVLVSGSFDGQLGLTCHVLQPAVISAAPAGMHGGKLDVEAAHSPRWTQVDLSHPFCEPYTR